MNPFFIALKELVRKKFILVINVLILSFSLGSLVIISVVERSLRFGTATAADPFDIVVGTEKDQTKFLLYSVYLQVSEAPPLFDLDEVKSALRHFPETKIAGLASSDSFEGHKIVGIDRNFFELSGLIRTTTELNFDNDDAAIVGARVDLDAKTPIVAYHEGSAHEGHAWQVMGKLEPLDSPYDDAILVPLTSLWEIHGFTSGSYLVNAAFIHPKSISDAYQIKAVLDKAGYTVIVPGEMLSSFFGLTSQAKDFALFLIYLVQIIVGLGLVVSLISLFNAQLSTVSIMKAQGAPLLFFTLFYFTEAVYILLSSFLVSFLIVVLFSRLILDQIGASIRISLTPSLELDDFGPVLLILLLGLSLSLVTSLVSSTRLNSKRIKQ